MKRDIHYRPHGGATLGCAEFNRAAQAWRDEQEARERRRRPNEFQGDLSKRIGRPFHPYPRIHSDVRRVNCPRCLYLIEALARDRRIARLTS